MIGQSMLLGSWPLSLVYRGRNTSTDPPHVDACLWLLALIGVSLYMWPGDWGLRCETTPLVVVPFLFPAYQSIAGAQSNREIIFTHGHVHIGS